jgi:hypothetical protein
MMENVPGFIHILFVLCVVYTLMFVYRLFSKSTIEIVKNSSKWITLGLISWLLLQGFLSYNFVYATNLDFFPPKMVLMGIGPFFLFIAILFISPKGRRLIDSFPLNFIHWIHIVRIPIEICLFYLYLGKLIPKIMTFEGRNFDILVGLSSIVVSILCVQMKKTPRKLVIVWNLIGMALLFNIILISLFSFPTPIQKYGLDQPNVAMLHFPFSWLPTFIVPIVLFSHMVSLRLLLKSQN